MLADEYYEDKVLIREASENLFNYDWFVRFFEAAGNISDEYLQKIWDKVLTGEYTKQGNFSLRTLDTLYNL